ncbi:hypothetical protein ACHAWF_016663, partial [Thalassiosira exigua]
NVGIAFEILEEGARAPPGYRKSSGHLVFDVKMDFTRKARWVKDGHRTPDLQTSSYAGVVSRDSIRIALTYAALEPTPTYTQHTPWYIGMILLGRYLDRFLAGKNVPTKSFVDMEAASDEVVGC